MTSVAEQATTEGAVTAASQETKPEPKAAKKPGARKEKPDVAPSKGKSGKKKAPKTEEGVKTARAKATKDEKGGVREGSKTATVLDLLKRPDGATLQGIMKATGWQAHSVRGFISGTLGKKMGLTVASVKEEDGERRYSIAK
jgi:hypothetical protein